MLPASLDPLQFAYRSKRSTDDAIAFTLHTALSHLENKNTYVRMLFVDYSSAFNTIVPDTGCEAPESGTEQISVQLDPGLPDRQKLGGQNGQQHLISPDPQHWCSAGLHPQPTPVLPARHIVGGELPSLQDIYTRRCTRKARRIIKDSSHPSHSLLSLLPSGRHLRSIRSRTSRLRDSFFPQAIRLMNSQN